ncbi:DUF885 domain-containing protein [Xenophilus sp. AP218F]|nr:DUF885 domain-containing protein [Xenophilus sp. AP218F]
MRIPGRANASLIVVAAALALTACSDDDSPASAGNPAVSQQETARLMSLLDSAQQQQAAADPYGFAIDAAGIAAKRAADAQSLRALQAIDRKQLSARDQLFYDMLNWDLSVNLESYQLPLNLAPINHFRNYVASSADNVGAAAPAPVAAGLRALRATGAPAAEAAPRIRDYFGGSTEDKVAVEPGARRPHPAPAVPQALAARTLKAAQATSGDDARLAWYQQHLQWLKAYDAYLVNVKQNFAEGKARSMMLPKRLVDKVLSQLDGRLSGEQLAGWDSGLNALPATAAPAFRADYQNALLAINNHYVALRNYLRDEYRGRPDAAAGDGKGDGYLGMDDPATPQHEGKAMYQWYLKKNTTTTMTPDEVHQKGLEEVARIYGQMKLVCHTVGKCGATPTDAEMKAFFTYLNGPQYRFGDLNLDTVWDQSVNPDTIPVSAYAAVGKTLNFDEATWRKVRDEIDAMSLSTERKQALKAHYQAIYAYYQFKPRMAAQLDKYFDSRTIPAQDYAVVPVPYASAPYDGVAYYDNNRFYLNTYSPYQINSWSLSTLLAHEAAPGHHFQIAIASELAAKDPKFPSYVANSGYTAYAEGWALYTEYLADADMGMYRGNGIYSDQGDATAEGSPAFNNQLQYFGRLNEEMLRAMRMVVDTGIHWKGWSYDQARQYMHDNSALGDGDINSEVPRYMAYVGQAASYKAGQLTILKMRKQASDRLGGKFDIKAFHHQVLEYGALPMSVFESKIGNWIRSLGA